MAVFGHEDPQQPVLSADPQRLRRGDHPLGGAVERLDLLRARAPGSPYLFDVQYWFFYPYNGPLSGFGGHEGDWEHITVRVWDDGTTISEVYYSAHDNEGDWYLPSQILYTGDGRPVAYSAQNSHASYPWAGTWVRNNLPDDHTADGGPVWDCRRGVWNVSERGLPLNKGRYWLNYSGRWGEIGEVFSGPWGPAYQGYWNAD